MLESLIKLSPCPVDFKAMSIDGWFEHSIREQKICIKYNIPIDTQIATLAHELGHAMCYKNNCICFKKVNNSTNERLLDKRVLCEYHAFIYSLQLLYVIGNKLILQNCMSNIISSYYNQSYKYKFASKHIMNTIIWKRCIKFAYGHKQLSLV